MKKMTLVFLLMLLLWTSGALAANLACNPPGAAEQITGAQVEMDGVWEDVIDVPGCTDKQPGCVWTDGQGTQHFILRDLSGASDGQPACGPRELL